MGEVHPAKAARHNQGPPLGRSELEDLLTEAQNVMRAGAIVFDQAVRENATTCPESERDDVTIVMTEEEFGAVCFMHEEALRQIDKVLTRFFDSRCFEERSKS